jgi:hypothetical protein
MARGEIRDLGDATLHNEKVGVVDIELDALEESLHSLLLSFMAIKDVFRHVWKRDL